MKRPLFTVQHGSGVRLSPYLHHGKMGIEIKSQWIGTISRLRYYTDMPENIALDLQDEDIINLYRAIEEEARWTGHAISKGDWGKVVYNEVSYDWRCSYVGYVIR